MCIFFLSKTSIQVCFCFATSYFSASCHWRCTFIATQLFWSPRAQCASALLACVGWRVWERNTGCLNRCYQGFKFQSGSNVPRGYLFYSRCPMYVGHHTYTAYRGGEKKPSYTGCVMTALSHFHYSRKALAAAGEGNIGLATSRSFDLLLLPLHFTFHWTVPAGRMHTELHERSHAERRMSVRRDCACCCR